MTPSQHTPARLRYYPNCQHQRKRQTAWQALRDLLPGRRHPLTGNTLTQAQVETMVLEKMSRAGLHAQRPRPRHPQCQSRAPPVGNHPGT